MSSSVPSKCLKCSVSSQNTTNSIVLSSIQKFISCRNTFMKQGIEYPGGTLFYGSSEISLATAKGKMLHSSKAARLDYTFMRLSLVQSIPAAWGIAFDKLPFSCKQVAVPVAMTLQTSYYFTHTHTHILSSLLYGRYAMTPHYHR